jgi:CTP synthase
MIGCQFHPEFLSRPTSPHPLFSGFIKACCQRRKLSVAVELPENLTDKNTGSSSR